MWKVDRPVFAEAYLWGNLGIFIWHMYIFDIHFNFLWVKGSYPCIYFFTLKISQIVVSTYHVNNWLFSSCNFHIHFLLHLLLQGISINLHASSSQSDLVGFSETEYRMLTKVLIISWHTLSVNSFFFRQSETSGRHMSGMYSWGTEMLSSWLLEHETLPLINADITSCDFSLNGMAEVLANACWCCLLLNWQVDQQFQPSRRKVKTGIVLC